MGTLTDDDIEFMAAFHNRTLPSEEFRHRGHLRLTWLVLKSHNAKDAAEVVAREILRLASYQGAPSRYHATLTRFWVHMVGHAIENRPDAKNVDELIDRFPLLLEKDLPYHHWSRNLFDSDGARAGWIVPDLLRLP